MSKKTTGNTVVRPADVLTFFIKDFGLCSELSIRIKNLKIFPVHLVFLTQYKEEKKYLTSLKYITFLLGNSLVVSKNLYLLS